MCNSPFVLELDWTGHFLFSYMIALECCFHNMSTVIYRLLIITAILSLETLYKVAIWKSGFFFFFTPWDHLDLMQKLEPV